MNSIKKSLINIANKLPYVRGLVKRVEYYNSVLFFPPEHYYSPIVCKSEVKQNEQRVWPAKPVLSNIDLNEQHQLTLLAAFKEYQQDFTFPTDKPAEARYYLNNAFFTYNDAYHLYSMMRYYAPSRIIEIGSGFSSAIMLEVNERFFNNTIALSFIEPFPGERLNNFLTNNRPYTKYESFIQDIDLSIVKQLSENDILFVDSSHVSKTGSDLNFILFDLMPVLKPGVIIHFHDIFFPFEYPKEWVYLGRSWNEAYLLRAFLMNNPDYKIVYYNDYISEVHSEKAKEIPVLSKSRGSSLWIQKIR